VSLSWTERIVGSALERSAKRDATVQPSLSRRRWAEADPLERPSAYAGWIFPVRCLAARRYLKLKEEALVHLYLQGAAVHAVPVGELHGTVLQGLRQAACDPGSPESEQRTASAKKTVIASGPLLAVGRWWSFYPLLILAASAYLISRSSAPDQSELRMRQVFATAFVAYSDIQHRIVELNALYELTSWLEKQLARSAGGQGAPPALDWETARNDIRSEVSLKRWEAAWEAALIWSSTSERKGLWDALQVAMRSAQAPSAPRYGVAAAGNQRSEIVTSLFRATNKVLEESGDPFYIDAMTFTADCFYFLPADLRFGLLSTSGPLVTPPPNLGECSTTILLPYEVERRVRFVEVGSERNDLPVSFVHRIDYLPVLDSALGLTYKGAHGSIVLMDKVREHAERTVLSSLAPRLRAMFQPVGVFRDTLLEDRCSDGVVASLRSLLGKEGKERLETATNRLAVMPGTLERGQLARALTRSTRRTEPYKGDKWVDAGVDAATFLLDEKLRLGNSVHDRAAFSGLPGLDKIETELAFSTAAHEAHHQYVEELDVLAPWEGSLLPNGSNPGLQLNSGRNVNYWARGVADEVGAYLFGMVHGKGLRHMWVAHLALFAVNPAVSGTLEEHAGKIVLCALYAAMLKRTMPVPGSDEYLKDAERSKLLGKVADLNRLPDDQIGDLAQVAYEMSLGREFPKIESR